MTDKTDNTEEAVVEAIAGIIVRDVLNEDFDDLVEGYLDEIMIASRRIMRLPAYAEVGKLFKERLDDAITFRDARLAELEGERDAALRECSDWARQAGLAIGKLETSELAGIVDDWKARALKAESRLAEAVGALREVLSIWDQWGSLDSTDPDDRDAMEAARQALSSVGEG